MQQTGNNIGVMLDHPDINYVKMDGAYDIEGERVDDSKDLQGALLRCKNAMQNGRPYLVNVRIEKRLKGKNSDWYDFYSVAKWIPRQS